MPCIKTQDRKQDSCWEFKKKKEKELRQLTHKYHKSIQKLQGRRYLTIKIWKPIVENNRRHNTTGQEDSLNNTHAKTGVSFNGWALVKSHHTNVSPIHDLTSDLWSQQDLIICDTG